MNYPANFWEVIHLRSRILRRSTVLLPCDCRRARGFQYILVCLAAIGLSACTVLPSQHGESLQSGVFPAAFQQFLVQTPAGSRAVLAHSPWGSGVTVIAHDAYFAASGHTCRKLTIVQAGMRRPGLVCRLPDGRWQKVRALARSERLPVVSNRPQPELGAQ